MENVGGQAVIDGVMIRNSNSYVVAVKSGDVIKLKRADIPEKQGFLRWPFVRGVVSLVESMSIGMNALDWSSRQNSEEEISKKEVVLTIAFAFAFSIVLFVIVPYLITRLLRFEGIMFNLMDGLFRIFILLGYIFVIGRFKDIQEIFQYHGAEHKAVNCFEDGKEVCLENARNYSTIHPRCGTSFLVIVAGVSILLYSLINVSGWWKLAIRIALLPVVAGISYEILKLSSKSENFLLKVVTAPGMMVQRMTTAEPSDSQLEVGIRALNELNQISSIQS